MLLRELLLIEKALTPAELEKHDGKYLRILIDLINADTDLPVDPEYRGSLGDFVRIDPSEVAALQTALDSGNIRATLPKKIKMFVNGEETLQPPSILFKGAEFTGAEGKKSYNAGHLAELFMGLVVSAKFFNAGGAITNDQVLDMIGYIDTRIEGKNFVFTITREISYPEMGNKKDSLSFLARIPACNSR